MIIKSWTVTTADREIACWNCRKLQDLAVEPGVLCSYKYNLISEAKTHYYSLFSTY